jgi:hypothetical protein
MFFEREKHYLWTDVYIDSALMLAQPFFRDLARVSHKKYTAQCIFNTRL